jgi:hypothetical protein
MTKKVVYKGYLGSILVPEVGVFDRDVPRDVSDEQFDKIARHADFHTVEEAKPTKNKGGDES